MPFLLNEEAALKSLLSGMTVADSGNQARPVGVFYGQPDKEIRQQSYPYLTIDLINISEATERVQSGTVVVPYEPEGWDGVSSLRTPYPMPINLDYQITTFSRQPRHDRQILAQLLSIGRLPVRFGAIAIPQDNTNRRLENLGFSKRDTTEADKRLFMNVFSIRIASELFRTEFNTKDYIVQERRIGLKSDTGSAPVDPNTDLYHLLQAQQSQFI
jgi:hypothetical protein